MFMCQFTKNGEIIVYAEIFYHGALRQMIVYADIKPLFATFSPFLFWPLGFDFATFPSKYKDDDWHFEFEGIIFFHLHSKNFCLTREKTEFELIWWGAISFLDDVGVHRWYGDL